MRAMEKICIFDTTLRDGEQSPGINYNLHEKLQIAGQLARLGVDVIEAGFPATSNGDYESVKAIAQLVRGPEICALSRAILSEVEHACSAIKYAQKSRLHVFVATSDLHIQAKLRSTREKVLERIAQCARRGAELCENLQFAFEDASRTELSYLIECTETAIAGGAKFIVLPDTVGYTTPEEYRAMFEAVIAGAKGSEKAVFGAHCHNDLGMAVANSFAALAGGARQLDVVVNGIGERAGNASLEEVVMALRTRAEHYGFYTDINTEQLMRTSALVSHYSGINIPANKPIVGENAFKHESGIHQHGVMANPLTYEIMRPQDVGINTETNLVLGKHSGMHAFKNRLEELGFLLAEDELERAFGRFKMLADKKKYVQDEDLIAIANENASVIPEVYELDYFHSTSGINTVATSTVQLRQNDKILQEAACGDGPVDATFKAIERAVGCDIELTDYFLRAVTSGKDALGEVTVRIKINGQKSVGRGISTDIIEASARGLIAAINKHIYSHIGRENESAMHE